MNFAREMPWQIIVLLFFAFWLLIVGILLAFVSACETIRRADEADGTVPIEWIRSE